MKKIFLWSKHNMIEVAASIKEAILFRHFADKNFFIYQLRNCLNIDEILWLFINLFTRKERIWKDIKRLCIRF